VAISPAIIAAGIGAVGSIGGALLSSNASSSAAQTQANAADQAGQTQLTMYNQTRSDLAPYLNTGTSALAQLAALFGIGSGGPSGSTAAGAMSALQNDPGYQFQFQQGLQGLDRSAASRGLLLSGAQLKDAQTFGQGQAQSAFGNYTSLLSSIAGMGQNAGAQVGGFGATAGQGIANSQLAAGQATAAGQVGSANALTSGLSSGLQNALLAYQLYGNQPSNPSVGSDPSLMGIPGVSDGTGGYAYQTSDVRAKTDIRRVGSTDSGLGVYVYRLKGSPTPQMGVMAQEVERIAPHAVRTGPHGLKMVNYRAISELEKFKEAA